MTNSAPTHILYAVVDRGRRKAFWQPIGAAWANQDGKGFSIKLNFVPLQGQDVVLREALPPKTEDSGSEQGSEA